MWNVPGFNSFAFIVIAALVLYKFKIVTHFAVLMNGLPFN